MKVPAALAAHQGDPGAEYEAARAAAALAHRAHRALVRFGGDDRAQFLQGLLSNDVAGLEPGDGCQALFLDTKGHVRAVLDIWAADEEIVMGCETSFVDDTLPDLAKYVLAADVVIDDRRGDLTVAALMGPDAERVLTAAGGHAPADEPGCHAVTTVAGVDIRVARTPDLGAPGFELHIADEAVDTVGDALTAAAGGSLALVGQDVAEALRIEAGVPRLGHEIGGEEFPQELLLDDAIDYEKGCYLGQETVARIHYRGQVNRLLSGVQADCPLPRAAELVSSEREVGRITSVAQSPQRGTVALAMVRREESEAGATVTVRAAGATVTEARVVALPIGS